MTLESTPRDATHWSTRAIAKRCSLSQTAVSRIWRALALQPHRVETFHQRHRAVEFRKFLGTIDAAVPSELDLHLILDNHSTHKTPPSDDGWRATSAPSCTSHQRGFLDQSRRALVAALTEKQIRRGVHRSTRELETAIHRYIQLTNSHPKPFIWTKTADQILENRARFRQRISNSGH